MTERFVSQMAHLKPQFKVKALSLALTLLSAAMAMPAYALQEISESDLGEATAEGIAFLPENTSLIFRGAGTTTDANGVMTDAVGITTETEATILSDRTKDTGYIRYIPVGPLTTAATGDAIYGATTGKADLFLYGLAISKGDRNYNKRFNDAAGNANKIASWGTSANPWLLKVETASSVSNFSSTNCTGAADPLCKVSFLALETPLYDLTLPTTSATGADAYNLKVAFWADAFVRLPSVVENMGATGTQFDVGGAGRANRLRLQAVMDGLSVNGTILQLFQTLAGATSGATNGHATNTFYNNTLGLAGVLRINSGDTRATAPVPFTATTTSSAGSVVRTVNTTNRYSAGDTSNISGRATSDATGQPGVASAAEVPTYKRYRLRSIDTVDTITTGKSTATLPSTVTAVRLSTQETGTVQGLLATPAIGSLTGGGIAPTFDPTEGLFLYGLNANIVLGSLAQPLIIGKETGNNNLVFELTAIPNKAELYQQIYTAYAGFGAAANGVLTTAEIADNKGSTCNVYQCGAPIQVNGVNTYQGNTATHGSITIGSTNYSGTTASGGTNLLTGFSGAGAFGVSFGALKDTTETVTTNRYYELQQQRRDWVSSSQWKYSTNDAGDSFTNGTANCASFSGNCNEFDKGIWMNVVDNFVLTSGPTAGAATDDIYKQYIPDQNHPAYYLAGRATEGNFANGSTCTPSPCTPPQAGAADSVAWGPLSGAVVVMNAGLPKQWNENPPPALPATPRAPFVNLGSAVIDGILIQHLKITTKGL